jgi:ABC-type nitrate/sulfonate/bicarbonate transport system substrate-binding protein
MPRKSIEGGSLRRNSRRPSPGEAESAGQKGRGQVSKLQRVWPALALTGFLVTMLAGMPAASSAEEPKPVSVVVFPGGFNWPIWVAQEKGFFAEHGISVALTPTLGSAMQLVGMIDGKWDIAMTALDNVVAYAVGQGEIPVGRQPDLFAFMGADNGFLSIVAVPEVKRIAALKERTVTVDALTTGYAFVLFDLLQRGGLNPGAYKVEIVGGVLQRWQDLHEKKHDATLLLTPFEVVAKAEGFTELTRAIDVYRRYQGLVGAARRSWAKANRQKVVAYIRGYAAGVDWLYDRENREEAIAILRKNLPQMSPEVAAESYKVLLDPRTGFTRKLKFDVEGARKVLELRSEYGKPPIALKDPMRFYDASYYDEAMRKGP